MSEISKSEQGSEGLVLHEPNIIIDETVRGELAKWPLEISSKIL